LGLPSTSLTLSHKPSGVSCCAATGSQYSNVTISAAASAAAPRRPRLRSNVTINGCAPGLLGEHRLATLCLGRIAVIGRRKVELDLFFLVDIDFDLAAIDKATKEQLVG